MRSQLLRRHGPLAPFLGRYVHEDHTIEVREVDGELWQFGGGWPVGKWLAPVGRTELAIPGDFGRLRFERPGPHGYESLVWDFGDSSVTYWRSDQE